MARSSTATSGINKLIAKSRGGMAGKKKPKFGPKRKPSQWGWSRRPKKCADDSDDETLESMKARAFAAL